MGKPRDFYEVLNIPKDSSPEDIRRAYKTLVMKWHPDKHPLSSKPEAEAKFKAIAQAYEQALNEIQGKPLFADCDVGTGEGGSNRGRSTHPPPPGPTARFRSEETVYRKPRSDPKDVRYTASSPKPGFASNSSTGWRKPPPLERKLECTLEELFSGCRKEICFDRDVVVNGLGLDWIEEIEEDEMEFKHEEIMNLWRNDWSFQAILFFSFLFFIFSFPFN